MQMRQFGSSAFRICSQLSHPQMVIYTPKTCGFLGVRGAPLVHSSSYSSSSPPPILFLLKPSSSSFYILHMNSSYSLLLLPPHSSLLLLFTHSSSPVSSSSSSLIFTPSSSLILFPTLPFHFFSSPHPSHHFSSFLFLLTHLLILTHSPLIFGRRSVEECGEVWRSVEEEAGGVSRRRRGRAGGGGTMLSLND